MTTAARAQPAPRPVVLLDANVLDPASGVVQRNVAVIVRDGRIAEIGPPPRQLPLGADVIRLDGRWVLPGLMDAHTHIASRDAARRAVESGVTTARSASTPHFEDVALRALAKAGAIAGPDLLAAGLFVTPDLGETVLADPRLVPLAGGVNTPDQLRALVRLNLDRGADVIKTRGTERAGLPNTDPRKQVFDSAQVRAIVDEAATKGAHVLCHAHGDEGARACVVAGARSIEHGTYLSDSTLRLMAARGTWLVPTYTTVHDLAEPGGDYDDPVLLVRGRHMLPVLQATVRRARALGVAIATGVDTQYGPQSTSRVSHEVEAFVNEMGFPALDALRAATSAPARLFGLENVTGAMRTGFEADLIVVPGNPLEDIRALQDVQVVLTNGRVVLNRLPFGRRD
jgi:imidazolonepropionase-like amidohydrolase